jgi:hypothetical protein
MRRGSVTAALIAVFQRAKVRGKFSAKMIVKPLICLTKNAPENRSVGGSTPPLGTIAFPVIAIAMG